jgi:RNA polymerase sigma-70 factor (ECF subfamily)
VISQPLTLQFCGTCSSDAVWPLQLYDGVIPWLLSIFTNIADIFRQLCSNVLLATAAVETPARNDAHFVSLCQSGNRNAFDELVVRHQDMIFSLCVRLLGNRSEGEDAAQETFVKAFESLCRFKGSAAFSTWLYTIAVNVCRNRQVSFWNRLHRKAVRIDESIEDEEGPRQRELPGNGKNPEELLAQKRTSAHVRSAVSSLPQKLREIVVLADLQDLSYEEIQAATNLPLGTIKSRLARGRENLKSALKGVGHEA